MTLSRRGFLAVGGAAATTVGMLPASVRRNVRGANDELRVAVVGIRSRGRNHINGLHKLDGVRVVAVADCDRAFLDREQAAFDKRGEKLRVAQDYRELLDAQDVDVISIATPNHWHALMAIQACQAGKDVYVEKPVSHTVWEGRQIVHAAEKYGRIVQTGTQSRSNPGLQSAVAFARDGKLGAIQVVRGLCYKPRKSIGKVATLRPIPATLDYDLWCGPAELEPLRRRSLHYDWHWVWPTGNGDLGNQGIHQMDMCRMVVGGPQELPRRVQAFGGRFGYDDDGTTPNTMVTRLDYEGQPPIVFEVRGLPAEQGKKGMDRYRGAAIGVVVECEGGHLSITNYAGGKAFDRDGKVVAEFRGGGNHYANFVGAVRSRDRASLNADILEGHLSSAMCHVGNISMRVGRDESAEGVLEQVHEDKVMTEAWGRVRAHLAKNGVSGPSMRTRVGSALEIDPVAERFTNDAQANFLLHRNDREPFVVPSLG